MGALVVRERPGHGVDSGVLRLVLRAIRGMMEPEGVPKQSSRHRAGEQRLVRRRLTALFYALNFAGSRDRKGRLRQLPFQRSPDDLLAVNEHLNFSD